MWNKTFAAMAAVLLGASGQAQEVGVKDPLALVDTDPVEALNRLLLDGQPEGENAWPLYEAALREFVDEGFDAPGVSIEFLDDIGFFPVTGVWDGARRAQAEQITARWRGFLDAVDSAALPQGFARPYVVRIDPEAQNHPDALDPQTLRAVSVLSEADTLASTFQAAGRANLIAMRFALEREDWDGAARRLALGIRMGSHLTLQRTMIEWTVASEILRDHLHEVRLTLTERRIPEVGASSLLTALDGAPSWPAASYDGLMDASVALYAPMLARAADMHGIERDRVIGFYVDSMAAIADESPADRSRRARIAQGAMDRVEFGNPWFHAAEQVQLCARVCNWSDRRIVERAATRIMLLIELHHGRTGAWPERLEEVVGEAGIVAPVIGESFRYRRLGGDDALRGYELRLPSRTVAEWLDTRGVLNPARE